MTTTSYGFAGSLGAADFAKMARYVGPYGVLSASDWAVTAVGGSRAVSIAAGEAFGWNVRSVSDAAQTVALPTPTAGQWFLIVATRDWSAKTTTANYVAGPTTTTTTPTTAPSVLPAAMNQSPGTLDAQALAWAWVNNTSTVVTVVDLRTPVADLQQPRFGATAEAATSLPGAFAGQRAFALDNGITYRWNGAAWRPWDSDWTDYYPSVDGINGAAGAAPGYVPAGRYRYVGGKVRYEFRFYLNGGSAASTGSLRISLPVLSDQTATGAGGTFQIGLVATGRAYAFRNSTTQYFDLAIGFFNADRIGFETFSGSNGVTVDAGTVNPFTWAQSDYVQGGLEYDPA